MATSPDSPARRAHRLFYGGLLVLYALILVGWWSGNQQMFGSGSGSSLIALARLFGLTAGFAVLTQVFLMSRVPLIDQRFNLHEIVWLHRWNGYAIVAFIWLHVDLMIFGYAAVSDNGLVAQFAELVTSYEGVFWALLAVILIFTAVAISIGAARRRLPYEVWYYVHLSLYAAILLALFHQINIGGDLVRDNWFRYFWLGLYAATFGIWAYYRGLRMFLMLHKHDFRIARIEREAEGIYSIYVSGKKLDEFSFEAGQYAGWRMLTRRTSWQNYPYSFSAPPSQGEAGFLRFTINTADGPFTRSLPSTRTGTRVLIDGPRGSFTARRATTGTVVLVAGGIGVAPYLALIPELLKQGLRTTLLYAARSPEHVAFSAELQRLEAAGLAYESYLSSQSQKIDTVVLQRFTGSADVTFYLCGPDRMITDISGQLRRLGVSKDRIITERFNV